MSTMRVLCVDDDPKIRETLPAILERQGLQVTVVGSVAQALSAIASRAFEVLISDLNIGEPGDGFTVVSAMRRTHPECINFILTGYPALESALQALRSQVDEYIQMAEHIRGILDKIGHLGEKLAAESRDGHGFEKPDAVIAELRASLLATSTGREEVRPEVAQQAH
jgi:DNA-binding NtrC family response regulator